MKRKQRGHNQLPPIQSCYISLRLKNLKLYKMLQPGYTLGCLVVFNLDYFPLLTPIRKEEKEKKVMD